MVNKKMIGKKVYLGDGTYVNYDGGHVVLTTENGIWASNTIYLDSHVLSSFQVYLNRLTAKEDKDNESLPNL